MDKLGLILLVFSFVCFCVSAFWVEAQRVKLIAVGLAFLSAAFIFGNVGVLFK